MREAIRQNFATLLLIAAVVLLFAWSRADRTSALQRELLDSERRNAELHAASKQDRATLNRRLDVLEDRLGMAIKRLDSFDSRPNAIGDRNP